MNLKAQLLIIALLSSLVSLTAQARPRQKVDLDSPSLFGYALKAGVFLSLGQMGSKTTYVSRSMDVLSGYLLTGFRVGPLSVGPVGQYQIAARLTDPAQVSNTNLRGQGYLVGGGLGLSLAFIDLTASYDFFGSYGLTNLDSSGQSSSLSNPLGFTVILGVKVISFLAVDLIYSNHSYGTRSTAGIPVSISSDAIYQIYYGVGLSLHL